MWVNISEQQDSAEWIGILDNNLYGAKLSKVLKSGDKLVFHPLDIVQIWPE
jgi:hypothetical protein